MSARSPEARKTYWGSVFAYGSGVTICTQCYAVACVPWARPSWPGVFIG